MLVAGIFNIHHKLHYPRPCSPPPRQRQCSLCLLSPVSPAPAPAVVCPPDTRARTPESWWYLAAASPPAAASLVSAEVRWGGQAGILARLEAAATVTVPGERSVWRRGGRTPEHGGGETSSGRGKAVQNYPWAFGKQSLGSDQWLLPIFRWKNIPFKSDVYWVQKSLSNCLLFTVFWFSLGQILVLATYMPWL